MLTVNVTTEPLVFVGLPGNLYIFDAVRHFVGVFPPIQIYLGLRHTETLCCKNVISSRNVISEYLLQQIDCIYG